MIAPSRAIGRKPWRVAIEQLIESTGGSGAPVTSWEPLAHVLMERTSDTVVERMTADQVAAREEVRWQMPYAPWMDPDTIDVPKMRRLRFSGRNYDIGGARRVGELGQRIELVTLTSSKASQPQRVAPQGVTPGRCR
jgi:head-tail adaptor